jgi:hypothetical protein
MTRLLLSPDFTREETEVLAEEILRRHGIGVTGARVAARFARSLPSQPRPGAGTVETKYMRLWPFWLSAHLIARARRIEATYETYYVDSETRTHAGAERGAQERAAPFGAVLRRHSPAGRSCPGDRPGRRFEVVSGDQSADLEPPNRDGDGGAPAGEPEAQPKRYVKNFEAKLSFIGTLSKTVERTEVEHDRPAVVVLAVAAVGGPALTWWVGQWVPGIGQVAIGGIAGLLGLLAGIKVAKPVRRSYQR